MKDVIQKMCKAKTDEDVIKVIIEAISEFDTTCVECGSRSAGICRFCRLPLCRTCADGHQCQEMKDVLRKKIQRAIVKQKEQQQDKEIVDFLKGLGLEKI